MIRQHKQKWRNQVKIAIPMNEKSIDTEVCPSFGRAPYFLFYDSVTKETYYLDNEAVASQGGAGIRAAQASIVAFADADDALVAGKPWRCTGGAWL